MATDVFTLKNPSGTTVFNVDSDGTVTALAGFTYSGADDFGALGIKADVIAESTAAAGVTIDGVKLKDGIVLSDDRVIATIAVANATGGATGAALTLTLKQADNSTAITTARQVFIGASAAQYAPYLAEPAVGSVTFGTATTGSIVASGTGWALVQTSAAGAFACTVTNTDDETIYFYVATAPAGSDLTKAAVVVGSNSDAAAWSA